MKKTITKLLVLSMCVSGLAGCKSKRSSRKSTGNSKIISLVEVKGYEGFGMVDATKLQDLIKKQSYNYLIKDKALRGSAPTDFKVAIREVKKHVLNGNLKNGDKVEVISGTDQKISDKKLEKAVTMGDATIVVKGLKKLPKTIDLSKNNAIVQKELDYSTFGINGYGIIAGNTLENLRKTANFGSQGINLECFDLVKLNGKAISKNISINGKNEKRSIAMDYFNEIEKLKLKNGDKITLKINEETSNELKRDYKVKIKNDEATFTVNGLVDLNKLPKDCKNNLISELQDTIGDSSDVVKGTYEIKSAYISKFSTFADILPFKKNIDLEVMAAVEVTKPVYSKKTKKVKTVKLYDMSNINRFKIYQDKGKLKLVLMYESNDLTEKYFTEESDKFNRLESIMGTYKTIDEALKNEFKSDKEIKEVYQIYPSVKLVKVK